VSLVREKPYLAAAVGTLASLLLLVCSRPQAAAAGVLCCCAAVLLWCVLVLAVQACVMSMQQAFS
jgi:hypothetical protein